MVLKTGVFFMVLYRSVFDKMMSVMASRFRQFLEAKVGAGRAFNFPYFAKGKPDFVNPGNLCHHPDGMPRRRRRDARSFRPPTAPAG
jgi:hypothetical protein